MTCTSPTSPMGISVDTLVESQQLYCTSCYGRLHRFDALVVVCFIFRLCVLLYRVLRVSFLFSFFFFNDTATTEIYTLSLHDALPISVANRLLCCGRVQLLRSPWLRRFRAAQTAAM